MDGNDHNLYNFIENSMYVGASTVWLSLLLLPWGCRRRSYWFFAGLVLIVVMTLLGAPYISDTVRRLPLLRDTHIQRSILLLQFSLAACCAIAWHQYTISSRRPGIWGTLWISACLILMLASIARALTWPIMEGRGWYVTATGVAVIAMGLVHLLRQYHRSIQAVAFATAVFIFLDLHAALGDFNPTMSLKAAHVEEPQMVQQIRQTQDGRWARFTSVDGTLVPNTAALFGVHDLRGYEIPIFQPYIDFLSHAFYGGHWPYDIIYWHSRKDILKTDNKRFLNLLGVRHIAVDNADGTIQIIENPEAWPLSRFATTGRIAADVELIRQGYTVINTPIHELDVRRAPIGSIQILPSDINHIRLAVAVDQAAVLVVNTPPQPGWKATLNQQPMTVFPVNVVQTGMVIPEGQHKISLNYFPASFRWGLVCSLSGIIIFALLIAIEIRKYFLHASRCARA
jgi:hypothetical protein